ncbi:MAG: spore gernimation protein [Ruminiclostridium sp.]|nr:spore gernimation protein [Ruminiclostridium sp.]
MIKEGKIGVQEAICLVVISTSNRVFFTAPTVVQQFVGTAGWYMSLVSDITAIVFFTFIYLLLKRFPEKDIIEIFHITFGRSIGVFFSYIYATSFLAASGILLREFYEALKTFIFPYTPISILNGTMVILVTVSVFLGLETIARAAKLVAYFLLFGYLILLILSAQNFRLPYLFPILGYGVGKTLMEGLTRSSAYSEVIVLTVFAGALQGAKHLKKAGYISLVLSGLLVSAGILCMSLIFPYNVFQEQTNPLYTLATLIKYGTFFQRLDPAFLFLWIIITIISSSVVFYCAVTSYCKTFRLQDKRPVIIPMAVLLFTITMIPRDLPSVITEYIELLRTYPIFLFYILPLIALITAKLRKKKGGNINA